LTDFLTTITNGDDATAFANWWTVTVPATVPASDRYICEIGTESLREDMVMLSKVINGDIIVRAVSGEEHNGVRGTGIQVRKSGGSDTIDIIQIDATTTGTGRIIVTDLEILFFAGANGLGRIVSPGGTTVEVILKRCLLTNNNIGDTRPVSFLGNGGMQMISCRMWDESGDIGNTRMVSGFINSASVLNWIVQGCTLHADSAIQRGIDLVFGASTPSGALIDVQGNLIFGTDQDLNTTAGGSGTIVEEENVTEDLTGQVTGASIANEVVSVANLDLKAASKALLVWDNKPTTFGAEIDIHGDDRDVVTPGNWDSGSDQFSTGAEIIPITGWESVTEFAQSAAGTINLALDIPEIEAISQWNDATLPSGPVNIAIAAFEAITQFTAPTIGEQASPRPIFGWQATTQFKNPKGSFVVDSDSESSELRVIKRKHGQ